MLCQTGSLKNLERSGFVGEEKYDGTRVLIIKKDGRVKLQNRLGIDYTNRLAEFVEAAQRISGEFILDGEAVYINPSGKVELTPCQRRCATQDLGAQMFLRRKYPLVFKAFDIIMLNGVGVSHLPYIERKTLLSKVVPLAGTIEYVPFRVDVKGFFEEVKARGDEGIIIKRVDSRYEAGERSFNWLKIKNWKEEVCRVVGYTPGKNARSPFFGALVLATEDGRFRGCVGSGFDEWMLRRLKDIFSSAPKTAPPFDIGEPYTAVNVDLKVEVQYYKATEEGVLRFPVFRRTV